MATYNTTAIIKTKLGISVSTFDTQIDQLRQEAYDWINNRLLPFVAVPITPPQLIMDAEANIAAGRFQEERFEQATGAPPEISGLRKRGETDVEDYIIAQYKETRRAPPTGGLDRIVGDGSWIHED